MLKELGNDDQSCFMIGNNGRGERTQQKKWRHTVSFFTALFSFW